MEESKTKDEQPDYRLGAARFLMWVLVPAAACIIQLRQAAKLPTWSGYLRFMAAWQMLGIAHRLLELWLSGRANSGKPRTTVRRYKSRTIATAGERAQLLPGTICRDSEGNAWKRGEGSWVSTGGDTGPLFDEDDRTLTVLWEPAVWAFGWKAK